MSTPKENDNRNQGKSDPAEPGIRIDLGLGGIFKGLGNFLDILSELSENAETVTRSGNIEFGADSRLKGVYGVSVRSGIGGSPKVESFGNIRKTDEGTVVTDIREPIIDVFEEGETILLIVEIPGVNEAEIEIQIDGDILELSTLGERKYAKEVLLPTIVDAATLARSYNNGVLEVRLQRLSD